MWIPSNLGVMGNKRSDHLAGEAVQGDTEFAPPVRPSDLRPLSRVRMLDMMSNHSCLRSHLGRINIVKNLLCVCFGD
jgi:hypothetical protein